jgi:hypothetical protein
MPYKDKAKQNEYTRKWIARRRAEWFADKMCTVCGSTIDLELHHVDPSSKVSHSIWSWSQSRRDAEAAKCEVLCSFHHEIETRKYVQRDITHGTHTKGYARGCRCQLCTKAHAEYARQWRKNRK